MKSNIASILLFTVLLSGCVVPKATTPPAATVNFRQYPKVRVVMTDSVDTDYSRSALPMFEGLLKGRLQSAGYTPVETAPQMILEVNLTQFDPGDRVLRTMFKHGIGRAVCKYTVNVKDSSGNLQAAMRGGKIYHGQELIDNPILKSDEAIRMGLISYPVSQIGKFIESNGWRKSG